jgi:phosphopantothenoylcysteine decarboxylase/phosphopantothenate--cysteine ligase
MSTGETGAMIASEFVEAGMDVTFFHGINTKTPKGVSLIAFSSFDSLNEKLASELSKSHYDYIIHLAAISDFSVDYLQTKSGKKVSTTEKISSSQDYSIKLKQNPKIIGRLKNYSKNKNIKIIGFKLTHTTCAEKQQQQILNVFKNEGVDIVVHNELAEIQNLTHEFTIHSHSNKKIKLHTKQELAMALVELVHEVPKIVPKKNEVCL